MSVFGRGVDGRPGRSGRHLAGTVFPVVPLAGRELTSPGVLAFSIGLYFVGFALLFGYFELRRVGRIQTSLGGEWPVRQTVPARP